MDRTKYCGWSVAGKGQVGYGEVRELAGQGEELVFTRDVVGGQIGCFSTKK